MGETGAGVKKYVVKLSAEERESLEAMIGGGKRSAQLLTRARILLKADTSEAGDGWTDRQIAEALDTSLNTVFNVRQQLVEEGFEATLARKYNPNSARPRIFDGAAEAKLIALACSQAPEGFARLSLRLLEEKVVELNVVEKASDNTIGRTLKKAHRAISWVIFEVFLQFRQARGQDFQLEIFLVAQAVRSTLNDANFVVEAFDEAEGDFVARVAVGGDAVPVSLNHLGKRLVGLQALPTKLRLPIVKKLSRPGFGSIRPKLIERLAQNVRRVQPLVGRQEQPQTLLAFG